MGRFDPRWQDEHREAIIGAVLDQGHSIRHTVKLASQGALAPAPFEMPYSTAREYVNAERKRRETATAEEAKHGEPAQSLDHIVRRSLTLLDAWLRKLERAKDPQPAELERLLRGVKAARDLTGPSQPQAPKKNRDAGTKEEAEWSPTVASMLAASKKEQRGTTEHGNQASAHPDLNGSTANQATAEPIPCKDGAIIDPAGVVTDDVEAMIQRHGGRAEPTTNHYSSHASGDGHEIDRAALRAQLAGDDTPDPPV